MRLKYDAVIIGFGKGGKTLAAKLAANGQRVAMIEKSEGMYGGTCINVGCIPSKSLIHSARLAQLQPANFKQLSEHYTLSVAEKRRVTTMLRQKNFDKLNDSSNVDVYTGKARFLSSHSLQIEMDDESAVVQGDKIFINTGSTPVIPPIQGLRDSAHVYDSAGLMDLQRLPRKLVIIGGGYIGMEFASMYADFGAEVSVVQDGETFLPREDADIAEMIQRILEQKGVTFYLGMNVRAVEDVGEQALVRIDDQQRSLALQADAVLVATGRRPNTEDLNLEAAGIQTTPRGAILVDDSLRTSAPNVWAMGDVVGGLQFTYVSLDDYRIVWSQLSGEQRPYTLKDRKNVPYSVFLDPPFSRVGLSEAQARDAGYNIKVAKLPVPAIPKAQVLNKTFGVLKAIVDMDTKKILGATLLCEESHEMINIVKLAMDMQAEYTVLRDQVFTHPTMSEALNDLFAMIE